MDQAGTLRFLVAQAGATAQGVAWDPAPARGPRVVAISGGKGGVGKTLVTANLGLSLASLGMRVLLIDGDIGLANLDVVLGVSPRHTLDDVLMGEAELGEVLVTGPWGVRLLAASSGFLRVPEFGSLEKILLADKVGRLEEEFDVVLIDTPAGVSGTVRHWTSSSGEVMLVVTGEPTSIVDAYATLKLLRQHTGQKRFQLLVNQVDEQEALGVYERLSCVAGDHLGAHVDYLGWVPADPHMVHALRSRVPCVQRFPFAPASGAFRQLAQGFLGCGHPAGPACGTLQLFWKRMLGTSLGEGRGI